MMTFPQRKTREEENEVKDGVKQGGTACAKALS
jgi:hypothetical protein